MLDVLDSLVRKSLVNVDRTSAELRYSMLETIRQYAHDKLEERGEAQALRRAHALHFMRLAELNGAAAFVGKGNYPIHVGKFSRRETFFVCLKTVGC